MGLQVVQELKEDGGLLLFSPAGDDQRCAWPAARLSSRTESRSGWRSMKVEAAVDSRRARK